MRKVNFFMMVIAILVLSVCLSYAGEEIKVGDPLPKITLTNIKTNQTADIGEITKGKASVIVYMQTSCAACRKELDALKEMLEYAPDANIIAISVDVGSSARILKYIEHYQYPFTFLHDPNFTTPELFGFSYTPATVVSGKDGKILLLKGGYRPGDQKTILELVQENLKKP